MPMVEDVIHPLPGIKTFTYEDVNAMLNFQQRWIELVILMRNYFRSTVQNNPDLQAISDRLFGELPLDFYNEFKRYFSEEDSQHFLSLFSQAVNINMELANAYKNNDQAGIDAAMVKWYKTVADFAKFLSSINKYWDEDQIKALLNEYISLKIEEIIAFLNGDYELEARIFEAIENKAIDIAAYMTTGMIRMRRPPEYTLPPKQEILYCGKLYGKEVR